MSSLGAALLKLGPCHNKPQPSFPWSLNCATVEEITKQHWKTATELLCTCVSLGCRSFPFTFPLQDTNVDLFCVFLVSKSKASPTWERRGGGVEQVFLFGGLTT